MKKINQLSEKQINFILSTAHDGGVNIRTILDSEFLVLDFSAYAFLKDKNLKEKQAMVKRMLKKSYLTEKQLDWYTAYLYGMTANMNNNLVYAYDRDFRFID